MNAYLLVSLVTFVSASSPAGRVPVLLELFTSEGCSSCPPADRLLASLDEQPIPGADLIVLSEHVDYWNQLGWKDPFSSSRFSVRQQNYTEKFHMDGVYTPQLVVYGTFSFVGSDSLASGVAIRKAIRSPKIGMVISKASLDGSRVTARIEFSAAGQAIPVKNATLFVAIADNRAESHVARGENAGHSLTHVAVVRSLARIGLVDLNEAGAREVSIPVEPSHAPGGVRVVAFLQDLKTGRVLGAAMQKL
jgi:hypothetical protein